jgi:hypothetical protein
MRVELLYFDGCQHWPTALEHLEEALGKVGRTQAVQLRAVTNEAEAQQHEMAGSPTILIDGRDPFPSEGPTWGCRLYPVEGSSQGAPTVASLVEVLSGRR